MEKSSKGLEVQNIMSEAGFHIVMTVRDQKWILSNSALFPVTSEQPVLQLMTPYISCIFPRE